ncbi:MAG: 50S ribosomal protein L11 methyltransferase [Woeseiaceae bacterium]|nr:50S ribosomal protein L11 methyltransferase [Woeseiaceae bacterium]
MQWRQFIIDVGSYDPDVLEAVFVDHGAYSVTLTDAGDQPVLEPGPGETPLWQDTRMAALFAAETDLDAVAEDLRRTLAVDALPRHRIDTLTDRAWEREWLKDAVPMRFGDRLWVCPGESKAPPGAAVVRLDPGLAFGTGTHATTALVLEWLERLDLHGRTLLDYGCGSGVLAIAALTLGCRRATAMDIDAQAVTATRANAAANGVLDRLEVVGDDASIVGTFDVLVANILAEPLVTLAESLSLRLSSGGELALSGILSGQVNKIRLAYRRWIDFDAPVFRSQGDQTWALLSGRRRDV